MTSRHQKIALIIVESKPKKKSENPNLKACIYKVKPKSIQNALIADTNGHGLASTI
jgi:hypothetical protein